MPPRKKSSLVRWRNIIILTFLRERCIIRTAPEKRPNEAPPKKRPFLRPPRKGHALVLYRERYIPVRKWSNVGRPSGDSPLEMDCINMNSEGKGKKTEFVSNMHHCLEASMKSSDLVSCIVCSKCDPSSLKKFPACCISVYLVIV